MVRLHLVINKRIITNYEPRGHYETHLHTSYLSRMKKTISVEQVEEFLKQIFLCRAKILLCCGVIFWSNFLSGGIFSLQFYNFIVFFSNFVILINDKLLHKTTLQCTWRDFAVLTRGGHAGADIRINIHIIRIYPIMRISPSMRIGKYIRMAIPSFDTKYVLSRFAP